jgi:ribosome maturation factor RimP
MSHPVTSSTSKAPQDQIIELISPWVAPLGYQIIYLEVQSHRQKTLRIYIDHLPSSSEKTIGIEDCVKVSRILDEILDQLPEVQAILPGAYELEVSSPGVDRPLRTADDFQRFAGHEVRIHVYRPMTREELENEDYQSKNPKQKNFLGTLVGFAKEKIILAVSQQAATKGKSSQRLARKSKAKNAELTTNSEEGPRVAIPLPLISKANLEPQFDFEDSDERE